MDTNQAKQEVRERIWALLEQEKAVLPPGARGRIPNFVGAEQTAERLASLPAWQSAQIIMSNPDKPQLPVRTRAVGEGKLINMAVPNGSTNAPPTS